MNNISLIGRLVKDPELKNLSGGSSICNFMLAVDREYKDSNGQKVTDFIPCLAWSPAGKVVAQYFKKGDLIGCVGRLESRSYETESGEKKTYYAVNVNKVDFIQGKSGNSNSNARAEQAAPQAPQAPQKKIEPSSSTSEIADDYNENVTFDELDLPFDIPD